jgi:predicted MFS family arabinose efflux permease
VTSFGWSGSAALGGFLIHRYGFQTTFLITALVQVRDVMSCDFI